MDGSCEKGPIVTQQGGETDSSVARGPSRPGRLWTRLWQGALVLLLLIVVCLLALRWHWRREFHRRLEAIRAAGYPATPKENDAWYEWPRSGENAAHWILGAMTMYQESPKEDWSRLHRLLSPQDKERPHPAKSLAPDLKDLLESYTQTNAQALKALHEATVIEDCRYPIDLSGGPGTVMRHIGEVSRGARLLCLEAILYAERGDPNGATEAITAAVHVAESLAEEPVMISHMVRLSGLLCTAAALERVLNHVEFADRQLEMLDRAFRRPDLHQGLLRALAGDRGMVFPFFDRPQVADREIFDRLPPRSLLEVYTALGLAAREGAIYLDFARECLRIAQLPVSQYRAALEAAQRRYLRSHKGLLFSHVDHASGIMRREAFYVAWLQNARVLLAVERYRYAQGELPQTLNQLIPSYLTAIPEDPFDGKPLRYNKRRNRGYVVYSVGEDGRDDGGRPPAKEAETAGGTWDFVFQICR